MQLGIDLRLHAYAPGGISRYARRLARAVAEELVVGEDLTLISHRRDSDPLRLPAARSYRAWTPPHHRLERWALGAEIWPLRLDVLHSTDFIPPAWGARRLVTTVHDLNFLHYPEYLTKDARRYYNEQIAWGVSRADAILVDSYATQRDLQRLLGVDPERVTVTYLAADERFRVMPKSEVLTCLERFSLTPGYLLFVGVWEPRKNLPGLLESLALLRDAGDASRLVIVGRPGWLYDEIYARVRTLDLVSSVRFIEAPSVDDLVGLYNGAAALIMPSFYEGFGLPPLEAMQCGTPTIVSNRASLPEVVGHAGLLVDPDDPQALAEACLAVLSDAELRQRMRQLGLQQASNFTWQATAEKTVQVYRTVARR